MNSKDRRKKLQAELEEIISAHPKVTNPADHVSYQPNEESQLVYPCFVYTRDPAFTVKADNLTYLQRDRYEVTYIDRRPDDLIFDIMSNREFCSHSASFAADGLNHTVWDLYN